MSLIYKPTTANIVLANYDDHAASIIVTWYTMIAPNDMEPCYRAMVKTMQEHKPTSIIMNTSEAKNTIRPDDLEWIENYFFPRAIHYGAKDIIFIPPTSAITKDAVENYSYHAEKNGLHVHTVEDLQQAVELAFKIHQDAI